MNRPPTLDQQRGILTEKASKYRMIAWESEVDAEMIEAEGENADQQRSRSQAMYRMADRCDERLAKLPKPQDDPKKPRDAE